MANLEWTAVLVLRRVIDALIMLEAIEPSVGQKRLKSAWFGEMTGAMGVIEYADYMGVWEADALAALNFKIANTRTRNREGYSEGDLEKLGEAISWQTTYLKNAPSKDVEAFQLYVGCKVNSGITIHKDGKPSKYSLKDFLSLRYHKAMARYEKQKPEFLREQSLAVRALSDEIYPRFLPRLQAVKIEEERLVIVEEFVAVLAREICKQGLNRELTPADCSDVCISRSSLLSARDRAAWRIANGLTIDGVAVR